MGSNQRFIIFLGSQMASAPKNIIIWEKIYRHGGGAIGRNKCVKNHKLKKLPTPPPSKKKEPLKTYKLIQNNKKNNTKKNDPPPCNYFSICLSSVILFHMDSSQKFIRSSDKPYQNLVKFESNPTN